MATSGPMPSRGPKNGRNGYINVAFLGVPNVKRGNKIRRGYLATTILCAHTALGTESSAPFVKERGPRRKI